MEKKIVFISSIQLFPPLSGGQLRSANLCQSMVEMGHEVEIYSFTGRKNDYLAFKRSEKYQISANLEEYINRNLLWGAIQFLFYKLKLPPFWITLLTYFYCPKQLKNKLEKTDLIIIDFPFLYPIFYKQSAQKIINTHNAEFELYSSSIYTNIVKKIELSSFKYADKILFCSNKDLNIFNKISKSIDNKSIIVPNGINLTKYFSNKAEQIGLRKKLGIDEDKIVFLFSGSAFEPNLVAFKELELFIQNHKEILINNNILILVVGSVTNKKQNEEYFKVCGPVEEIIEYFKLSDFGLNNISSGSGTNVKMFEYIASNLPILSTSFGARGLDLNPDEDYFLINLNLKDAIIKATQTTKEERVKMARYAFLKNEQKLNMKNYLKDLF